MNPKLKSKIFIFIWVCSLCCIPKCFAQYFQQTCDINGNADFAFDISESSDGNLIVFGVSELKYPKPTFFSMKLSNDGSEKIDSSFLTSSSVSYFTSPTGKIKKLKGDRGFILQITRQTPSTPPFYNSSEYGFARMDTNGKILFTKFYTDTNLYVGEFHATEVLPDGGFMLGGNRIERSTNTYESLLIRTDSMGNKIWEKTYRRSQNINTVQSLQLLPDGRILAGMYISTTIQLPSGGDTYYRNNPRFVLLDTAGVVLKDVIWSQPYANNNNIHFGGGGVIHKDVSGGFFHFGYLDSIDARDVYQPGYFAHLDSNFKADWVKVFDLGLSSTVNPWAAIQLKDSNYLLTGNRIASPPIPTGWAAKIDKSGTIIWQHNYSMGTSDAYLTDVMQRIDGSLVMAGSYFGAPSPQAQDVYIVGIDSNGCLLPGCDPTSVQEVAAKENNMALYPNPVSEQLNITGIKDDTKISIYSLSGSRLYQGMFNNATAINMSGYVPGIYLIQIESHNGFIERRKIVKQ